MFLLRISFAFPTMIPEARGTLWLADRLPGGLGWAGLAGGLAGWRAGGGDGCRIHIFATKNAHGAHLVENCSGIGKLVAKQFGHECREPKKVTEHV